MLPRWLTAIPRFAATWRDEILVVAVGLAYQASVTGPVVTRHEAQYPADQVVVRIAAPTPMPALAPVYTLDGDAFVKLDAVANAKALAKVDYRTRAAAANGARPRVT